ncbi:hypothetical protein [Jeotgalibacillus terrae]|uniref:Uncharacterized protein n=1 Tax=Jeotgalibacillus terrae TaxID=587735 RepID=A0ABW5ZDE7_9BACL|nr:hypothetical protein [Jeotgalibacillus terrae]
MNNVKRLNIRTFLQQNDNAYKKGGLYVFSLVYWNTHCVVSLLCIEAEEEKAVVYTSNSCGGAACGGNCEGADAILGHCDIYF